MNNPAVKSKPTVKAKPPRGRPITRQIKSNATPAQVPQAIFKAGRKPAKQKS